jgi:putative endonuclease
VHYVYVRQSLKDQDLYTGYTNDLGRRFREHTSGKVTSTRNRRPMRLIYYEADDPSGQ